MTDRITNREEMLPRVLDLLREKKSFLVTGHEQVDGDSSGCEIALYHGLRALGKRVRVVNNEELMHRYTFLDPDGACEVIDDATFPGVLAETDAVIVVDNNSWPRLAGLEEPVKSSGLPVICIDHHRIHDEPFSPWHLVDTGAAATGELVYDILCALGVEITPPIAEAIYTTLCADTGWFRYSNTTRHTFEICAHLVECGARPDEVNVAVNYQDTLAQKRLAGRIWDNVTIECDGTFAWTWVSQAMIREHDVAMVETDGFIDDLRALRGIKIAAILKQLRNGKVKVSLRSRNEFCAHDVAAALGGGGHHHASGITLVATLSEAIDLVTGQVRSRWPAWTGGARPA